MAQHPTRASYLPVLDGVRAVSILIVVLSHLGLAAIVPGAFGVTLFFFLSGFLITRQLLAAIAAQGRPDFGLFYLRRALRLLPASTVYILVAGGCYVAAGGRISAWGWVSALFYGANYYDLWAKYGPTLPGVRHPFNILWSLAIEEHFYAVWPVTMALLGGGRRRILACVLLCAVVPIWRWWLLDACFGAAPPCVCGPASGGGLWRYNRLYLATDTRVDSIAWGALLAFLPGLAGRPWIGAALLAAGFAWPGPFGRHVMRPSLQGAALLLLLPWLLNRTGWVRAGLTSAPALYLGRLSYSLYLWHWAALGAADRLAGGNRLAWLAIAVPLSTGLSVCSYHGIEQPMLGLRRRAGSAVKPTAAAALAVAEASEPEGTHAGD
jgi:peptidoglycan/LPS O-acetylase OafA/YrhL